MRKFLKKLYKFITNRFFLFALSWLLQFVAIGIVMSYFSFISVTVYISFSVLAVIISLVIVNRDDNPAYKLAWVVPILALPFLGAPLYLLLGRRNMNPVKRHRLERAVAAARKELSAFDDQTENLDEKCRKVATLVEKSSVFPVYRASENVYYESGEKYFEALLAEIKKAEKFIFLEYFIIKRGRFWNSVLEVLKEKAASGVEVRVLWDDFGCLMKLPSNYDKKLQSYGIHTGVFNRIVPSLDARMNNRTHRKIAVIDGRVAFTGGINLADEYINEYSKFGHWKDTGVSVSGQAVNSFTIMFLSFWASAIKKSEPDFAPYLVKNDEDSPAEHGFVQPLSSGPSRNEQLTENAFIQMISSATKYVYINTPYLVIDNEMYTALCLAAKSGVDVRITMPYIPDKKIVFMMSRSFYPGLLKAGVKIYEYVPGFIHAKSIIADDCMGYCGTCNMDYRSFYLHHECGVLLYGTSCLSDMKADYLSTLKECRLVTYRSATNVTFFTRLARSFLRVFAPLL